MLETIWILLLLLQGPLPSQVLPSLAELDPASLPVNIVVHVPVIPVPSLAQPAVPPKKPDLVRGKAELSYVSTGGTATTQTIGTGAELVVMPGAWRLESRINFLRTETDEQVRARRLTGQVRAARTIGERAELFARGAYLRNTFTGIDHGVDGAAGVTAIIIETEPQRLSLDSGFGYIGEDRTPGPGRYLGTFDLGMRYQWAFSDRNRVTNDALLKTDLERSSDWRVTHVAALQASLNARLSLKLSHEVNYRNEPVPGFTRADTVASAAIVASF